MISVYLSSQHLLATGDFSDLGKTKKTQSAALKRVGYDDLAEVIIDTKIFCPNSGKTHGKSDCGRSFPNSFEGRCPECKTEVTYRCGNKVKAHEEDYFLNKGAWYSAVAARSDLLQEIVNYYPQSRHDLATSPSDKKAKVGAVESALVPRLDFEHEAKKEELARRNGGSYTSSFTLDVIPLVGEVALLNLNGLDVPASELEKVTVVAQQMWAQETTGEHTEHCNTNTPTSLSPTVHHPTKT